MSKRFHVRGRCRGDSEIVGTLLLTATVVVLVSVVGYYALSNVGGGDAPPVQVAGGVTSDAVTLVHGGGRSIDASSLDVVLRFDGTERRYDFEADGDCGDDDGRFEPGERWSLTEPLPYAPGDVVELLLVDGDRNAVLFRASGRAATPTPTPPPAPPV
ncbi:MAG: type IV pilin [Haloferacaceae archaeon]